MPIVARVIPGCCCAGVVAAACAIVVVVAVVAAAAAATAAVIIVVWPALFQLIQNAFHFLLPTDLELSRRGRKPLA